MPAPNGNLVTPVGFDVNGNPRAGNLPFTYMDSYIETVSNLLTPAGGQFIYGTAVTAGELWVVTAIAAKNINTVATTIGLGTYDGVNYTELAANTPTATIIRTVYAGWIPVPAGSKVYAFFGGCTLNDDIFLYIHGFKMQL